MNISLQAKLLGLNAMSLLGQDVTKYWNGKDVEEGEGVPEAKRFKANTSSDEPPLTKLA